jgi:hypothetical protein
VPDLLQPRGRANLPSPYRQKTEMILAGRSKEEMVEGVKAGLEKKELPPLETGAMCYMMSKQGYLGDEVGHWHPHVMFFVPQTEAATWGANLRGSPMLASDNASERLTIFLIPVTQWSDGTTDATASHGRATVVKLMPFLTAADKRTSPRQTFGVE